MKDRGADVVELIIRFPSQTPAPVSVAGGKGFVLARLAAAGFPVPPGWVLTTHFFAPWFKIIRDLDDWSRLTASPPPDWAARCAAIHQFAASLSLDPGQRDALNELDLSASPRLLVVRSSSPEEDLSTASFAGLYETRPGVNADGLEVALRACFASSMAERVLHYKAEHGMDPFTPQIAVIVQEQIDYGGPQCLDSSLS